MADRHVSQRDSGYERKERDCYETPEWVTEALLKHVEPHCSIWEPAAGSGKMARVLRAAGHQTTETDIETGHDFLGTIATDWQAIVTNPPYVLAQKFIERALDLTAMNRGAVFMLLRTDFDHAKTRQHLFGRCAQFSRKLVLVKRIQWFEDSTGSPSFNHAWFMWSHRHKGPPTLAYGP
jgi:hypothetical protein